MGYLNRDVGIADFSKAVIALFFRVPQDSINAAHARSTTTTLSDMNKTIPLLTFGVVQEFQEYDGQITDVASPQNSNAVGVHIDTATGYDAVGSTIPLDPCYIGLDCTTLTPKLVFHFQTATTATLANLAFKPAGNTILTYDSNDTPFPPEASSGASTPGSGWDLYGEGSVYGYCSGIVDITFPPSQPDYFRVETPVEITGDAWHCLILSPDFSATCSTHGPAQPSDGSIAENASTANGTDSFCRLMYSIDDVNYNGEDNLGPFYVDGQADDPNAILSNSTWDIANNYGTGRKFNRFVSPATASLDVAHGAEMVPSNGADFGIPAGPGRALWIEVMERAVLQIFTGVTLDTSVVDNRHAFFKEDGTPQMDFTIAEALLGKSPEIRFGYDNLWKSGSNQGTAGAFVKTGTITTYSTNPVDITP